LIRILFRTICLTVIAASTYISHIATVADEQQRHKLTSMFSSEVYIMNNAETTVPLYSSKEPYGRPIGKLASGKSYPFSYAGEAGNWLYGNDVFIKDEKRIKTAMLLSKPISLDLLKQAKLLGLVLLIALLVLQVIKMRANKATNRDVDQLELERRARLLAEQRLAKSDQKIDELNQSIKNEQQRASRQESQLSAEANARYNELVLRFEQKERMLKQSFEDDAKEWKQQTNVDVGRMQSTYNELNKQYESLKADYLELKKVGRTFDINFDGANYENLLKGRLYEIHFAQNLLADEKYEILSWTSDKGFENGIRVKSNGDPDFLVQYDNHFTFAVECKYRSQFYMQEERNRISWAETWQAKRYQKYQHEKTLPVFVVMGIQGEPSKPKHEYFVKLDDLIHLSTGEFWGNDKSKPEQQVVVQRSIFNAYIGKKVTYAKRILELTI